MQYFLLLFLFYVGLGAAFSSMSPLILGQFGETSNLIFFCGQVAYPLGYFGAGFLSDRLRRVKSLLCVSLVLHAFTQHMLFSATGVPEAMVFSALHRFFLAVSTQLTMIAALEGAGTAGFARVRTGGTAGFFLVHGCLWALQSVFESAARAQGHLFQSLDAQRLAGDMGAVFLLITILPALKIREQRASHEEYFFADAVAVLKRPAAIGFFLLSFAFYFSYQLVDYYVGSLLEKSGGMRAVYAGWFLAVLLELPFMPLTSRIAKRFGDNSLFYISLMAGLLRFSWLSLDAVGVIPLPPLYSQILHGIHYTGFFMGAVYRLRAMFPDHLYGTGNGAYMVFSASLGGISGNLFFGWLLFAQGAHTYAALSPANFLPLFVIAAIIHVAIAAGFLFLKNEPGPGS